MTLTGWAQDNLTYGKYETKSYLVDHKKPSMKLNIAQLEC